MNIFYPVFLFAYLFNTLSMTKSFKLKRNRELDLYTKHPALYKYLANLLL